MNEVILYVLAGAGVGFAIGLTGVGGGSLMTPLLLLFGFPPPVAIGTDLLYAALTKAGGALSHHRRRNVDWRIVALLATGSLPVSVLLHFVLANTGFQDHEGFGKLLTTSLGFMLIITSTILILRDKLRLKAATHKSGRVIRLIRSHPAASTLLMGILLGVCVTLSSVGAGAFGAAVLLIIYAESPAVRIIATDVAHAVPLTLVAGLGYLISGYVDGFLLASLLAGSLPAIHLGTHVSSNVPERVLQRILVGLLLLLGVNYAFF
ncbi:MAG: sulfite exporter TauE/SafE family protein [Gammaproteobacteria bacterium]|nr:sulfite exporter TauE/SafE family protein [Pseudomonadales bacterium]